MHHRQATQQTETLPVEPGNVSLPRAIVLHEKESLPRAIVLHNKDNKQTLGFPPVDLAEQKRVIFSTPLCARCVSADGLWSTNCLVLSLWDTGAQLEVSLPDGLTEFYLLFTFPPRPVSRQCRRVSTRGNVIEVACLRKQPAFLPNTELNL
jgi:hypothetical protein